VLVKSVLRFKELEQAGGAIERYTNVSASNVLAMLELLDNFFGVLFGFLAHVRVFELS
jgi:hypothetical protein